MAKVYKINPWMVATFVLIGLTAFSVLTGFNVTGLFVAKSSLIPSEVCEGVQDLIVDIKAGQLVGNMQMKDVDICYENGKPIVYFFGSNSCGYCRWEHPIVEKVVEKFGDSVSFHNNMDSQEDMDIFSQYSSGGIPTAVYGCKYYQLGAGSSLGEEMEEDVLTAYLCVLTGS